MDKITLKLAMGIMALSLAVAPTQAALADGHQHGPFKPIKTIDKSSPVATPDKVKNAQSSPQPVGLLLPAVQAAREAARRN